MMNDFRFHEFVGMISAKPKSETQMEKEAVAHMMDLEIECEHEQIDFEKRKYELVENFYEFFKEEKGGLFNKEKISKEND
jgi:hypothetical protein